MVGEVKILQFSEGVSVTAPTQVYAIDNLYVNPGGYIYFPDSTSEGSVRMSKTTNGLLFELRENSSWVEISTIARG